MPSRPTPHRRLVRQLSAAADVDQRTATRALTLGVEAIHGGKVREAIVDGASALGIKLPGDCPSSTHALSVGLPSTPTEPSAA